MAPGCFRSVSFRPLGLAILLVLSVCGVNAQVSLQGTIRDSSSLDAIAGACFLNQRTQILMVADHSGRYVLEGIEQDSIVFSYPGYQARVVSLRDQGKVLDVYLSAKVHLLPEAEIVSSRLKKEEKKVLEAKLENFEFQKKEASKVEFTAFPLPGIVIHPLSFFYYRFSHEARMMKKLGNLYRSVQEEELLERRLPPLMIYTLTGNARLDYRMFLAFLHFTEEEIHYSPDADLYARVVEGYASFPGSSSANTE